VILNFKWKQEYIAKNLCENRAKPEMNCCGNCCLKKELQKQDKSENNTTEIKFKSEELFISSHSPIHPFRQCVVTEQSVIFYSAAPRAGYATDLFRPPTAANA
jgi:hypothetical protein